MGIPLNWRTQYVTPNRYCCTEWHLNYTEGFIRNLYLQQCQTGLPICAGPCTHITSKLVVCSALADEAFLAEITIKCSPQKDSMCLHITLSSISCGPHTVFVALECKQYNEPLYRFIKLASTMRKT